MAPAARIAVYKVCWSDDDPDTGGCYTSDASTAIDQAVARRRRRHQLLDLGRDRHGRRRGRDRVRRRRRGRRLRRRLGRQLRPGRLDRRPQQPVADHGRGVDARQVREHRGARQRRRSIGRLGHADRRPATRSSTPAAGRRPAADATPAACAARAPSTRPRSTARSWSAPRRLRPRRQERRGGAGRRRGDDPGQPAPEQPRRRLPRGPDRPRRRGRGRGDLAYVDDRADATASFELGNTTGGARRPLPQVAGFSSRGPALATGRDILKPDISAPGVSVLAAVAPPSNSDRDYDLYSGTSMASPHIAGLAAFMLGRAPEVDADGRSSPP